MTRGEWRRYYQEQRSNPPEPVLTDDYKEKLDFRAQIEAEIMPTLQTKRAAVQLTFKRYEDRTQAVPVPTPSAKVAKPEITLDLQSLSDKEGPTQQAALRKLCAMPAKLRERLDKERKINYPHLV